jgi:hypothetical protein
MKLTLLFMLILFHSFIHSNSLEYLTPSKNNRFKNVYFPKDSFDDYPHELFSYNIFIAPVTSFQTFNDAIDLCQGLEEIPLNFSCEQYFCNNGSEPFHFRQLKNSSLSSSSREGHSITHTRIERFCTICNQTFSQNFTLHQCNSSEQSMGVLCNQGACPEGTVCVPMNYFEFTPSRLFEPPFPICYDFGDQTFYAHPDFTHKVLYWVSYRWVLLIAFICQLSLLSLMNISIVLPEIFWWIFNITCSKYKPTCKEFFHMVVSIRNFSCLVLYVGILLNSICLFIDLWGFTVIRFSTVALYPSGATQMMCYMQVAILWQYILDQSSKSFTKIPKYSWKIM